MAIISKQFRVNDPVYFRSSEGLENGFIASVRGNKATVVVTDKREFSVPTNLLRLRQDVPPRRIFSRSQLKRIEFSVGDKVRFRPNSNGHITGTISRINPKRARVDSNQGSWNVPYPLLEAFDSKERGQKNLRRLLATAELADRLLAEHGLDEWRFEFDYAHQRGGLCSSAKRLISISEQFCLKTDMDEVRDTILHEIAHALVGPRHGHDKVWQAKALEIGCSARRTHRTQFTPPKYVISCVHCGWHQTRHKQLRGLICKTCKHKVVFEPYSDDLWNFYREAQ